MDEVSRRQQVNAGLVVVVVAVLAVWAVLRDFNGDFGSYVTVSAEVAQVGDSLQPGDVVTYRDVIVGKVQNLEPTGTGSARLKLRLDPDHAASIPSEVSAIAAPVDLFGATEIVLIPPRQTSGQVLASDQEIPADTSRDVAGLQTALADAYDLIVAVRPAELSSALTALGNALNGRGDKLNQLVRQANATLRALAPTIPQLSSTIDRLATVTNELADQAPGLLATVGNLLVPARETVRLQADLSTLLGVAAPLAGKATGLLQATEDDFVTIVTTQMGFLRTLAASPGFAGSLVTGLEDVARAINSIAPEGRAQADAYVSGINLAGILQTFLGKPSVVVSGTADPPLYTAADCPRYPGSAGPNCRNNAGRVGALTVGTRDAEGSAIGGTDKARMDAALASQITGLAPDQVSPGVGSLLAPLLHGGVVVLR